MKGADYMKRCVAVMLILVVFIGLMAGCGNANKSTDEIFSRENVSFLNTYGESVYRIIRPTDCREVSDASALIYEKLKTELDKKIKHQQDYKKEDGRYEILIGNTNRPESKQALDYLYNNGYCKYNDFIICTIGKKIVINGVNFEAVNNAAQYFVNNIFNAGGIAGGILYINKTEGEFQKIAINGDEIQNFRLIRDITSRSWLIQEEVRKLQDFIKCRTGFYLPLENDTEVERTQYEICIGSTNRVLKKSLEEYDYGDYEIKIAGNKVYLLGGSTYAEQVAVTEFLSMLKKGSVTDADSKRGSYKETVANYDSKTYYRYVWGDEFDTNRLLESNWRIIGFTNGKAQAVKNNATFDMHNGNIIMRAIKKDNGTYQHCDAIKSHYFAFNKGYLELRALIPDSTGVYSSFWLNGDGLEIDIFESLGTAHRLVANIHYWRSTENGGHISLDGAITPTGTRHYTLNNGSFSDQYHTVGFLWTDTEVRFFCDGEEYYYHPTDEYFVDKYLKIITGFNVGWSGRVEPNDKVEFPLEYKIDYLRLYQVAGDSVKQN